ncbi:hypothetical protein KNJ79_05100 [Sphingopyxis indica]|uniref:hypothetical protein n=1 Tax=Sphingopyxis indica TaxID=436663 RepID=UPI002938D35A|nr:hypothetical protein [Sphingopyxis indica]WOF44309.1 hypothetical protein KNJ79_05100 [Sphingopyxis indica]
MIPASIAIALRHVREHHPDVVGVTFAQEDPQHGGFWQYQTLDGRVPAFGPEIDVSLLEDALDAAWEDRTFPATYTVNEL